MTIDKTADVKAIEALLAGIYKAWAANDADAFVADYTEDATAILPGSFRADRTAIRDSMAAGFTGPLRGTTTVDETLAVRFVGADAAIVNSRSGILFPGETEVPAERLVNATWVLERRDGAWLAAAYHNSPVQVPALAG